MRKLLPFKKWVTTVQRASTLKSQSADARTGCLSQSPAYHTIHKRNEDAPSLSQSEMGDGRKGLEILF